MQVPVPLNNPLLVDPAGQTDCPFLSWMQYRAFTLCCDQPESERQAQPVVEGHTMTSSLKPLYLKAVIRGRIQGLNNVEIAEKYGMNRNTVNKYVKALKTASIVDLLRWAKINE